VTDEQLPLRSIYPAWLSLWRRRHGDKRYMRCAVCEVSSRPQAARNVRHHMLRFLRRHRRCGMVGAAALEGVVAAVLEHGAPTEQCQRVYRALPPAKREKYWDAVREGTTKHRMRQRRSA